MQTGGLYVLFVAGTASGKKVLRTEALAAVDAICWVARLRAAEVESLAVGAVPYFRNRHAFAEGWRENFAELADQPLQQAGAVLQPCIH